MTVNRVTMLSAAALLVGVCHASAQAPSPAAGCWSGTVFDGASQFRAAIELVAAGNRRNGMLHALARELDSDSLADISVHGDSLAFTVPNVSGARFSGRLVHNGEAYAGNVVQGDRTGPFRFARSTDPHPARRLVGYWSGALESGGAPVLRIGLAFAGAPCGDVLMTMDSPDQSVENLRVTALSVTGDSVRFEMTYIGGAFVGVVSASGDTIRGRWSQGGGTLDLRVSRTDSATPVRRPQEPIPPYPYDAEDVTFTNPAAGITLAGTLTLPRGNGPFPAAVLLSGSGAQNRDEALMGHRPFLVIADYLTRNGIAVLRYDDRGVGGSEGNTMEATLRDNAADAIAAVEWLARDSRIDGRKIGLIGHSEGGWVAPLAASRSDAVAFNVLLAGPGVSGEELLHAQTAALYRAEGVRDEVLEAYRAYATELFEVVREATGFEAAGAAIERRRARVIDSLPRHLAAALDSLWGLTPAAQREQQLRMMLTPWFRHLLDFDPRPVLAGVRAPILALIGEKDLQVPPGQNIPALRAACTASGHQDCTIMELEGLNHLFQHAETGRVAEYARIEETFAPEALDIISRWILARVGS